MSATWTSFQLFSTVGAVHRRSPVGGTAKGIPLYVSTGVLWTCSTLPWTVPERDWKDGRVASARTAAGSRRNFSIFGGLCGGESSGGGCVW